MGTFIGFGIGCFVVGFVVRGLLEQASKKHGWDEPEAKK